MKRCKLLLQRLLMKEVRCCRVRLALSQEEMAERLRVAPRSSSDLERGVFFLSAMSLMFFLLMLSMEDVERILKDFRDMVEERDVVA